MQVQVTHIDTACILIEINGFRILTDPTLDHAGGLYHHGFGALSRKTGEPALPPAGLGHIDLILLSHHQHKDNFDNKGKAFAGTVSQVISTTAAAKTIKGVIGLENWQTVKIATKKVDNLRITATPAQHRPWWIPEFVSGKVIGFMIEFDGQENGALYISGDTVYFKGIDEIAKRFKIDIGIFHAGGVQFRYLTGAGKYTMDSKGLIKAISVLKPGKIIPIHLKGWSHFKEDEHHVIRALRQNEFTRDKTILLKPGVPTTI